MCHFWVYPPNWLFGIAGAYQCKTWSMLVMQMTHSPESSKQAMMTATTTWMIICACMCAGMDAIWRQILCTFQKPSIYMAVLVMSDLQMFSWTWNYKESRTNWSHIKAISNLNMWNVQNKKDVQARHCNILDLILYDFYPSIATPRLHLLAEDLCCFSSRGRPQVREYSFWLVNVCSWSALTPINTWSTTLDLKSISKIYCTRLDDTHWISYTYFMLWLCRSM